VVVSGAAGAVGATVGQIAKIKGARVVGIAGGADKCRYLVEELGFDAAIDYKSEDVAAALKQHCPNGVSVFFDNVGGEILDAVLAQAGDGRARGDLRRHLAVQQSGNGQRPGQLPANYGEARHAARRDGVRLLPARQEAITDMAGWIRAGKLKTREDVVSGLESFPETFNKLFDGSNNGKLVLKVA
jgi:NADPH-dependent curcumin reductase CurA